MDLLYKYKSLEGDGIKHVIEMIKGNIYFPTVSQLNDPMELHFTNTYNHEKAGVSGIEDFKKKLKVISLSRVDNDFLMWVHYSNSFKGVCLGYERSSIEQVINELKSRNSDIDFSSVEYVLMDTRFDKVHIDWKMAVRKKLFQWAYEEEERIIGLGLDDLRHLNIKPVKLIFGIDVDPVYRELLEELMEKYNPGYELKVFHPNICLLHQEHVVKNYKKLCNRVEFKDGKTTLYTYDRE